MLVFANMMMLITRDYLVFTGGEELQYQSRPGQRGFALSLIIFIGAFVLLAAASVVLGILYTPLFGSKEPVKIIAHRCGGNLAAENSLEGVRLAIEHGCYGSETDTQRTKDGFYIINHDDTFERLCGVPKTSQEMTLEEIRSLTLKDENGEAPVPSLEELLDAAKDREVLYLELKGETADEKMAEDVVRMIREKDCVDDVVLISLKYDLIDYIETHYPEFETGVLMFAGIGNIGRLNCDVMIMEESMSEDSLIDDIHQAGKKAVTWTVNTRDSMEKNFDSDVDAIITDEVALALQIQKEFSGRPDLEVMEGAMDSVVERTWGDLGI
jgi:glycerophosphoryl diester phosphodiesterase